MKTRMLDRRAFLQGLAGVPALTALVSAPAGAAEPKPSAARLPRWRGFNLLEKFTAGRPAPFRQSDFEWMAEWGFDFVRLPLSYHCWAKPDDWLTLDERVLQEIDQAVAFGRRHGIHVNLNLHRPPGYCVNPPKEPLSLWEDEKALEACGFHWAQFARRYRGIPNDRVSFDLLNEPPDIAEATYARVVRRLVAAIRAEDPERLILADGLRWGRGPVHSLADLGVGQSTRGYDPMRISHYQASWVNGSDKWPEPAWPLPADRGGPWDKDRLRRELIEPWQALEKKGVGVHVGEWGAFNRTPHAVVMAWMKDCLALWRAAGWGWALWNLRGSFGLVDSNRKDVAYEEFRGHKLDRQMLELLKAN
jgi:endoglucanase